MDVLGLLLGHFCKSLLRIAEKDRSFFWGGGGGGCYKYEWVNIASDEEEGEEGTSMTSCD